MTSNRACKNAFLSNFSAASHNKATIEQFFTSFFYYVSPTEQLKNSVAPLQYKCVYVVSHRCNVV